MGSQSPNVCLPGTLGSSEREGRGLRPSVSEKFRAGVKNSPLELTQNKRLQSGELKKVSSRRG